MGPSPLHRRLSWLYTLLHELSQGRRASMRKLRGAAGDVASERKHGGALSCLDC